MESVKKITDYEKLPFELKLLHEDSTGTVYWVPERKAMICRATNEYMPQEDFKELFENISSFIGLYRPNVFVFDKRALKAFHQPSMEWYFTDWKTEMAMLYGLRTHRKLLPNISWFNLAVKAGRAELARKYPDGEFHKLDIQYRDNLKDAVEL